MTLDKLRISKHERLYATKRNLELAFGRKNVHFADLHTQFLQRKQTADESFSSFYVELWVLGDEMQAMSEDSKNVRAHLEMKVKQSKPE